MNITIVSLIFPPEIGSARRVGELAGHYAREGHEVTVVTGFPTYPKGALYPGYRKRPVLRERLSEKLTLVRVWLYTTTDRGSMIKRLLHYGTFTLSAFFGVLLCRRPDIIYVVSHPYFLGLAAGLARLFRGGKIIVDVQDSWPEAPIALGYIRWQWLAKFLVWTEKKVYAVADRIFTLSPEMAEHLGGRGADRAKIEVIYNWVDHERYLPVDGSALRRRLGLVGAFVVLYAGNIGKPQGLEVLVEAARTTESDVPARYVIVGEGAEKPSLMALAGSHGLQNVLFLPAVPEDEIVEYLGMADALFVHLKPAPHRLAVIPSKLQVYMAAGKPILLGALGAPARIVAEARCGVIFRPDDPVALAGAVRELCAAAGREREEMGGSGRRFAMRNFDLETQCSLSEKTALCAAGGGT